MSRDVILFGDSGGTRDLLAVIPPHRIKMIIGAERRPQYLDDLKIMLELNFAFIRLPGITKRSHNSRLRLINQMPLMSLLTLTR